MTREANVGMYDRIVEPTLLYGCEVWVLNVQKHQRIDVVKMNCLHNVCEVRRIIRIRNEDYERYDEVKRVVWVME